MEQLVNYMIDQINQNFDFTFMITANILTYLVIKTIDFFNGDKVVSTLCKRLVLVCSIITLFIIYWLLDFKNNIVLLNSAIAAPVFYSWIIKPLLIKFNIGYKVNH